MNLRYVSDSVYYDIMTVPGDIATILPDQEVRPQQAVDQVLDHLTVVIIGKCMCDKEVVA